MDLRRLEIVCGLVAFWRLLPLDSVFNYAAMFYDLSTARNLAGPADVYRLYSTGYAYTQGGFIIMIPPQTVPLAPVSDGRFIRDGRWQRNRTAELQSMLRSGEIATVGQLYRQAAGLPPWSVQYISPHVIPTIVDWEAKQAEVDALERALEHEKQENAMLRAQVESPKVCPSCGQCWELYCQCGRQVQ